jgi:hypothetical protein
VTPEQFCYWLQGFAELNTHVPNEEQWEMIQEHLNTVFEKVTPDRKKSKQVLNEKKPMTIDEAIEEMKKMDRPGMTCTPGAPGRIC